MSPRNLMRERLIAEGMLRPATTEQVLVPVRLPEGLAVLRLDFAGRRSAELELGPFREAPRRAEAQP